MVEEEPPKTNTWLYALDKIWYLHLYGINTSTEELNIST